MRALLLSLPVLLFATPQAAEAADAPGDSRPPARLPNIVFILADDKD